MKKGWTRERDASREFLFSPLAESGQKAGRRGVMEGWRKKREGFVRSSPVYYRVRSINGWVMSGERKRIGMAKNKSLLNRLEFEEIEE